MLTETDMIETINYYRAGDDDKLLELFQRFDSCDFFATRFATIPLPVPPVGWG